MSDLHARFERIARRGTARGGDAVMDAARRDVEGGGALAGIDRGASTDRLEIVSIGAVEAVELMPDGRGGARAGHARKRFGALIAVGGVAASLFVGALAVGSFVGNGGGSNSPEGAVRQLANAVSHEDPLAAADVLAPEEVRSLHGTVSLAEQRAQELALARSASAPLAGLDLSVDNLKLSTESLGDGYAKVSVDGGTISARTDNARFSPLMQQVLRNSHDNSAQSDLATLARSSNLPTFVVTVRRDGNWYVSAAYTALEYMREVNQLPAADFGSGVRATATLGAASPGAAVTDAMQAPAHSDWSQLISLAPPDEIPVYDYRAALEKLAADSGTQTNFTVGKIATTTTVHGDTAKVTMKASGTSGSGGAWSVDGSCFDVPETFSIAGESTSSSALTGPQVLRKGVLPTTGTTTTGSTTTTQSTCGLDTLSVLPLTESSPGNGANAAITVVREDGRWFVSPVDTVLDLVDNAITGVSRREIYTLLNVPQLLPPDGTITLGRPITLSGGGLAAGVYTFSGHRGERLLGLATTKPSSPDYGFETEVRGFGPDGKELMGADGMLQGQSLQLPTAGTYTFVIESFSGVSSATVTFWDEANAPAAAKHPSFPTFPTPPGESCTFSAGGGETCSSSGSVSSTRSTVPGGYSNSNSAVTSVPGG